jgi:hypothetical protein
VTREPEVTHVRDEGPGAAVFLAAVTGAGVARVHLGMLSPNVAARAFYDRFGFHEIAMPDAGPVTYLGRLTSPA